ncbi:MAG: hypothetical protein GEEBNDBF_02375 [bacterium]|nr:hypothetical protein [bacterium]
MSLSPLASIRRLPGWLLVCCLLLPVTAWTHPAAQGDDGDYLMSEEMMDEGMPPGDFGEMDPSAGPPLADVIKDCRRIDGLFTFFQNEKTGQTFLALKPEQLNKEFLLSYTLNAGSGGGMFIAPMLWPDLPVYFRQTYRTVQLIVPNTYVTARPDTPIARAVKTGTSDSVLLSMPLFCQPAPDPASADAAGEQPGQEPREKTKGKSQSKSKERVRGKGRDKSQDNKAGDVPETVDDPAAEEQEIEESASDPEPLPAGTVLLDASMIFFSDLLNMSSPLSYLGGGSAIDPMGSFITAINNFPQNSNVELTLNMYGSGYGMLGGMAITPDPRSTITKMLVVMSELPKENGYTPRLSDERIGYFLTMQQDFTDDLKDTRYVRYINRWHLTKQDPSAAVSDPVEPIIFWIENTVPHEYREGVRQGIEVWQKAFEAAGFSNAIIAKQMPDDADWDPADIRYNTIRWFVAPGAGFAIGPSRANPYTGQIYDADIGFSADMMAYAQAEYRDLVNPLGLIQRERARGLSQGLALPPSVLELREAAGKPDALACLKEHAHAAGQPGHRPHQSLYSCNMMEEALHEAAGSFYASQLFLGEEMDQAEFVRQFLVAITAHEVGHTLGLRHNYKASTWQSIADLATEAGALAGLSGSVMDYTGTNLAPPGKPQGEWFQTHLGPYDIAAIKYGYTPIPEAKGNPDREKAKLEAIAKEWAKPGHGYATDEDQYGWTAAMDPSVIAWDLGSDNLTYFQHQMEIANALLKRLPREHGKDGTRYQRMRTGFGWAMRSYMLSAMSAPRYIGGVYHSRNRVGDPDGSLPYTPVPAAEQRAALDFLITHYYKRDSFNFSPELLRSLAIEREPDFSGSTYMAMNRHLPIHDIVLNAQIMPLAWIYDPLMLSRLLDSAKYVPAGTDLLTMAELFGAVRGAVWEEAFFIQPVSSYRRNLQRTQLSLLTSIYLYGSFFYPPDAITLARLDLVTLRDALKKAAVSPNLDGLSRAHFQQCLDEIEGALSAPTVRLGF